MLRPPGIVLALCRTVCGSLYARGHGAVKRALIHCVHNGILYADLRKRIADHFFDLLAELLHDSARERQLDALLLCRLDADDDVAGLHRPCNAFGHDLHVLIPPNSLCSMGNSYSHLLFPNLLFSPALFKPFRAVAEYILSCRKAGIHGYCIALFMFFHSTAAFYISPIAACASNMRHSENILEIK